MEGWEQAIAGFLVREVVSNGFRHLFWIVLIGVAALFLGQGWRKMRSDIRELREKMRTVEREAKTNGRSVVIHGGIHISEVHYHDESARYRAAIEGRGEIESPLPLRVVQTSGTGASTVGSASAAANKTRDDG